MHCDFTLIGSQERETHDSLAAEERSLVDGLRNDLLELLPLLFFHHADSITTRQSHMQNN